MATIRLELFVEVADAVGLQPALFTCRDQYRAFDASRRPARPCLPGGTFISPRPAAIEKRPLMQIPDTAVAHRRGEPVVESNPARHKGGSPAICQNGDSTRVDVLPFSEIVHDAPD